jgi:uncharacterized protein
MRQFLIAVLFSVMPLATSAACKGQNLFDIMPPEQSARITTAAEAAPFQDGNFWQATKGTQSVTLIGTYHLDDPRHAPNLAALHTRLVAAKTLLVEAGPDEEKALMDRIARDPSLLILTESSLPDMLPEADWQQLSEALQKRGIPPIMGAKFRPWYVTMMLSMPSCDMTALAAGRGMDGKIMEVARENAIPIKALEPYDTVFHIFNDMTPEDQFAMIRSTLAMEDRADDYATTMADSYFAGHPRQIWELMRDEALHLPGYSQSMVDAEYAAMEEALMASRNRKWIPVIEQAAQTGPVVAAFGALHLSGDQGVANLLAHRGWTLAPIDLP